HEPREERRVLAKENARPGGEPRGDERQVEQHHDRDRDRRPGDRYGKLPPRLLRDPLELRHPAYRQEGDRPGGDTEAPRGERVPVLVEDHRREDGEYEYDTVHRIARGSVKLVAGERHPGEQDEERGMYTNLDPREASQLPRP